MWLAVSTHLDPAKAVATRRAADRATTELSRSDVLPHRGCYVRYLTLEMQ